MDYNLSTWNRSLLVIPTWPLSTPYLSPFYHRKKLKSMHSVRPSILPAENHPIILIIRPTSDLCPRPSPSTDYPITIFRTYGARADYRRLFLHPFIPQFQHPSIPALLTNHQLDHSMIRANPSFPQISKSTDIQYPIHTLYVSYTMCTIDFFAEIPRRMGLLPHIFLCLCV